MATTHIDVFLAPGDRLEVKDRDDGAMIKVTDKVTIYLGAEQEVALLAALMGRARAAGFMAGVPVVGAIPSKMRLSVVSDEPKGAA